MTDQYERERRRINALRDAGLMTEFEHARHFREVNRSEERAMVAAERLEKKREAKRRWYARQKLRRALWQSKEHWA